MPDFMTIPCGITAIVLIYLFVSNAVKENDVDKRIINYYKNGQIKKAEKLYRRLNPNDETKAEIEKSLAENRREYKRMGYGRMPRDK
ncbi:MAG: hypothetical protein LBN20_00715 [Endomicrobium sp.]|jgi:hypothetical protein|nr:hypothetical protein [Endomicrobium sp.]